MRQKSLFLWFCFSIGLVSAVNGADLYSIEPTAVVPGQELRPSESIYLMPIEGESLFSIPLSEPAPGKFYLRRKLDAKNYAWFEGYITDQAFASLHTFSLKDKGLSVTDMRSVKLFGVYQAKPFQDEQDVYFDKENLYTSRVPTLHFRVGGQWQTLESQSVAPGLLRIETTPKAQIFVKDRQVGESPFRKAPAQPGTWIYTLEAEGFLPLSLLSMVRSRQATLEQIALVPLDSTRRMARPPVVSLSEVAAATGLIPLERMHDQLDSARRTLATQDSAWLADFNRAYPPMRRAPSDLSESSEPYQIYQSLYTGTRERALALWLTGGVDSNHLVQVETRNRMRELESQKLRGPAKVVAAQFIRTDSLGRVGQLKLQLQSNDKRVDVSWQGVWRDSLLLGDTLVAHMFDSVGAPKIYVSIENKPVWIPQALHTFSRHFYRYLGAELVLDDHVIPMQGTFELPHYIASQPEVQMWWQSRQMPPPLVETHDTIPPQDSVVAPPVAVDTLALYQAYLQEYYRGKVVELDGGQFRYKNKLVEMSPFGIHATEVPQLHYERIILKNKSKFKDLQKPIHNINWYEAKTFCEEIGGNLPTEAQWEFAARAGSIWPVPWMVDSSKAQDHAIYHELSEAKGPKSPQYGPQEVGQRKPNAWGLYDMVGNVAEWTRDNSTWFSFYIEKKDPKGPYFGHFKKFKGGSWKSQADKLSLMDDDDEDPRYWGPTIGVRCVFPAKQKVDTAQIKAFFAKRQVAIPPFVVPAPMASVAPVKTDSLKALTPDTLPPPAAWPPVKLDSVKASQPDTLPPAKVDTLPPAPPAPLAPANLDSAKVAPLDSLAPAKADSLPLIPSAPLEPATVDSLPPALPKAPANIDTLPKTPVIQPTAKDTMG